VHVSALIDEIQQLEEVGQCINSKPNVRAEIDKERKLNRLLWKSTNPLVSLIIPTKNGKALVKACIESILEKTTYPNYEILLIDNGSDEQESIEYFKYLDTLEKVTVLKYPAPFNYSAINNFGVKHANGSILGLVNNDIEVISPDWLTYMVGHAERESIGCVGAKLLYSDTRIQHAGVVLGYGGGAGHAHKNFPRFHSGYLNRINATSNYSAVTAACLLVKKSLFDEVGGLNERDLSVAFNDVDFCLKVKELGVQNVYCAEAELFHHESVSRGLDISPEKAARFNKELGYLRSTWASYIDHDPAYSPNLTLKRENFSIKTIEELVTS
jgi:GT2 family glycosyltransferase